MMDSSINQFVQISLINFHQLQKLNHETAILIQRPSTELETLFLDNVQNTFLFLYDTNACIVTGITLFRYVHKVVSSSRLFLH